MPGRIRGRQRAYQTAALLDVFASDIEACLAKRMYRTRQQQHSQTARAETWREAAAEIRRSFGLKAGDAEPRPD